MKSLVNHLWLSYAREDMVRKSLLNCHAEGVHSIMLMEDEGSTMRLFVTDPSHTLYKNAIGFNGQMSVGYHPHHCDIVIRTVYGCITNIRVAPKVHDKQTTFRVCNKYKYHSKIKEGEMSFEFLGKEPLTYIGHGLLHPGQSVAMPATSAHTIHVGRGERAAWLVIEGAENPNYEPITWTNADLSKYNGEHLYKAPKAHEVAEILRSVKLID